MAPESGGQNLPTDFLEQTEPPPDEPSAAPGAEPEPEPEPEPVLSAKKARKAKKAAKKAAEPGTRYPSDPQYDEAEVALQAMNYADEAMSDEVHT